MPGLPTIHGRHAIRKPRRFVALFTAISMLISVATIIVVATARPSTAAVPPGFQDSVALAGLEQPTAVRFAKDGRIFVAEKNGRIKLFHGLSDPTPTIVADLRTQVHNFWDRGLLGLALDPQFPVRPFIYVLYAYDAKPGGTAPAWGTPGDASDGCPNPPGATADGC